MTDRYFRCTGEACGRKWHHLSLARFQAPTRRDLLDEPVPVMAGRCPSCGATLTPEAGTFESVIQSRGEERWENRSR